MGGETNVGKCGPAQTLFTPNNVGPAGAHAPMVNAIYNYQTSLKKSILESKL